MEQRPRRNSLRYPGYDYSQSGATFVTISTHRQQRLFGHVAAGEMHLSPAGTFVAQCWTDLPNRFPDLQLDAFIVMPDHLHGIILTGTDPANAGIPTTVGFAVRAFKSRVVAGWRRGVTSNGWPRYRERLWQRDYHDRIIRNDAELDALREYIDANPARWEAKLAAGEDQRLRR